MRRRFLLASALILSGLALRAPEPARAQDAKYARPELLVETGWVADHLTAPDVRIVDMRPAAAYAAGHVPGAVRLEEGPLRNSEDRLTYLPRPEVLARMLGEAGITNNTHVVIYDDQGARLATRVWYVLNAYGHARVSVVNGGWLKWAAEKRPVAVEATRPAAVTFTPKVTPTLGCTAPELLARKPDVVVLDARSAQEATAGRVPGSVNVEWKENVSGPLQTFKSADELKKLYAAKGITPDKEVVTYCASGGRASQSLFALKLLGYPKVKVYYGSWSDYTARPDAPVQK
jgi:thiosulfate/3-mercaptopyruvate sulfurtransferase